MLPSSLRRLIPSMLVAALPSAVLAEVAVLVSDIRPGTGSALSELDAAVLGDKLYFNATANGSARDLWVYDGSAPPAMVAGGAGLRPEFLTIWQGALHFLGGPTSDRELWRYDGTNPPVEVLDLFTSGSGLPQLLTPFGSELCFKARTSTTVGEELVCWDGTTAPDVYDLRPGGDSSAPENFKVLGDKLYFKAFDASAGNEPWIYEHFTPPTLLADVRPGLDSSLPSDFVAIGPTIYFRASDDTGHARVWSWDGVASPTMVSAELDLQGGVSSFGSLLLGNGFMAEGGVQMHVLRAGGFAPARWGFGEIYAASNFFEHRSALYFRSSGPAPGDLFRYCGGGAVERVRDSLAGSPAVQPGFAVFEGRIYFAATDATHGGELWALDPFEALFCDGFEDGDDDGWSVSLP